MFWHHSQVHLFPISQQFSVLSRLLPQLTCAAVILAKLRQMRPNCGELDYGATVSIGFPEGKSRCSIVMFRSCKVEQNNRPDHNKFLKGEGNQTTDEQIMAAVRKIMTDDRLAHPETAERSSNSIQMVSNNNLPKRANQSSLASLLLNTLRRKVSASKTAA